MTTRSPMLVAVVALLLAEVVAAMGDLPPAPRRDADHRPQGFACALLARTEGRFTVLEGRLEAERALRADYELRIRGPGVSVNQSGERPVAAGEAVVLGEARVTGDLAELDARLAVTVAGRTVECPLRAS